MNPLLGVFQEAFLDELQKIAAAVKPDVRKGMAVAQARKGTRPMRVSTMLKKEKDGTLWKEGEGSLGNVVSFAGGDAPGMTGSPAKAPRTASEVPSREDGRENVVSIQGPGRQLPPGPTNEPAERAN